MQLFLFPRKSPRAVIINVFMSLDTFSRVALLDEIFDYCCVIVASLGRGWCEKGFRHLKE